MSEPTSSYERPSPSQEEKIFRNYLDKNSQTYPRPAKGFLVKAELRLTEDRGVGVFATEFIPAGTRVNGCNCTFYNEQQVHEILDKLPSDKERCDWLDHTYGWYGMCVMDHEDGGFLNHSENPTISMNAMESSRDFASRDILPGEELTEDYRQYHEVPFMVELYERYELYEPYDPRFKKSTA